MTQVVPLSGVETPRLIRCAVLFLDLLGVRAMNAGADGDVQKRLVALDNAIGETVRHYVGPDANFPATFFSDTLVVAMPAEDPADAVQLLIEDAARLQMALAAKGFFVRGGLSLGLFYVGRGLIFGPALVEAYELESHQAVHPRIVLSRDAEAAVPRDSTALMRDGDGWAFVNYLDPLLEVREGPDADLEAHREQVMRGLFDHRGDKRIWEKYRWSAEYHNAFVARSGIDGMDVEADATTWRFSAFAAAA
jgi:hypothetical protein